MMKAPVPPQSGNKYSVSVLSTYSNDSSPSLLVTFPDQRYLFNTPEAISRIALQSKVGLRKVGNVFLGSLDESAGLPGFVLSSVEAGNNKIEIAGPAGTDHYLASYRFFTRREKLSLKISSLTSSDSASSPPTSLPPPVLSDSNLNVYAFPVAASPSISSTPISDSDPTTHPSSLKRKRSQSRSPSPRSKSPPGVERDSRSSSPRSSTFDATPSFQPSKLSGKEADTWRKMVIQDMFRGKAFDSTDSQPQVALDEGMMQPKDRKGPTPAYLPQSLPRFTGPKEAISYLAVGPVQLGRFLPTEATRLGVKAGKMFARLKNGERVWIRPETKVDKEGQTKKESKKDRIARLKEEKARQEEMEKHLVDGEGEGKWVTPEQCTEPGQDASAFLVLNLPSPEYLPCLFTTIPPTLFTQTSLGATTSIYTVFYFLGPGVVNDSRFQEYLSDLQSSLPSTVKHRVTSEDFIAQGKDEVTFGPSALLNLRLSKLDDEIFNVPEYSFVPNFQPFPASDFSPLSTNTHFLSSTSLSAASTSPLGGEIRSFNFQRDSEAAEIEASRLKGLEKPQELQDRGTAAWETYLRRADEVKSKVLEESQTRKVESGSTRAAEDALKVTPLGTGSAIPSKYRNVSSTLLHTPVTSRQGELEEDYILLDAGEGTWGQLTRRFGKEQARNVLRKIKLIFISHLHQDHHAGLATLLKERARLATRATGPLTIVAPSNARTYLFEQHQLLDLGLFSNQVRFIDNFLLEPGKDLQRGSRSADSYEDLLRLLDLEEVVAVPVLHRCRAWGVVITHRSGWRVVFSGDTMPCEALVEHGQDASLLVHEATIEDDLPEVALAKGHSTFAQAIDIGVRMRARHVLLTHFSARYPKLPPASSSATNSSNSRHPVVATAFDLMTLRLSDFWKMERYRDALDALLTWDEADEGKDIVA